MECLEGYCIYNDECLQLSNTSVPKRLGKELNTHICISDYTYIGLIECFEDFCILENKLKKLFQCVNIIDLMSLEHINIINV